MPAHLAVYAVIFLALAFDYVNGFHDAANSIATIVSTRVLSPRWAVVWAAFFNVLAYWVFHLKVAGTISSDLVDPTAVTLPVVMAGLIGAIVWDLITWYMGLPTSSSHALVGGFVGAAVAHKGFHSVVVGTIVKISMFIVIAPMIGMVLGFIFMVATYWVFRHVSPMRVGRLFRRVQLVSAAAYSLGHGGNDAQKTMGIIMAVLIASGWVSPHINPETHKLVESEIPSWVVIACYTAMGLGTLMGGWRIVKTLGTKICHLRPVNGVSAESAGAVSLFLATYFGIPVSTTHTITGAIIGVGATRGTRAVRWAVAGRVAWAWVLTIPAAALVAALFFYMFDALGWQQ